MIQKRAKGRMEEPLGRETGDGGQEGGVAGAGERVSLSVNKEGGGEGEGGVYVWCGRKRERRNERNVGIIIEYSVYPPWFGTRGRSGKEE